MQEPSEPRRAFQQAARELIADAAMLSEQMDAADASGWIVVSRDLETGSLHLTGVFETPAAALGEAQSQHEQMERSLAGDEPGWEHTVWPLFPPSPR